MAQEFRFEIVTRADSGHTHPEPFRLLKVLGILLSNWWDCQMNFIVRFGAPREGDHERQYRPR